MCAANIMSHALFTGSEYVLACSCQYNQYYIALILHILRFLLCVICVVQNGTHSSYSGHVTYNIIAIIINNIRKTLYTVWLNSAVPKCHTFCHISDVIKVT